MDLKNNVVLQEGVSTLGSVALSQFAFYYFFVEDPDTQKVKIQLTSLSGDANLYVSKDDPTRGGTLQRQISNNEEVLLDYILFDTARDGSLNSSFLILVHGFTQSFFSIQYSIETLKFPRKALSLFDGIQQRGTITENETDLLYCFEMPMNPLYNFTDIQIVLTPISGQFMTYFGLGYIPTSSNYSRKLRTYETNMRIKIPYRFSQGKHFILVKKNDQTDKSTHLFNIKYFSGKFNVAVIEGVPEFNNISRGDITYYYYMFRPELEGVSISVTPYSGETDLYLSINANNTHPLLKNNDNELAKLGPNSIYIKGQDYLSRNPYCLRPPVFLKENCGIYISVVCLTEKCFFSFNINPDKTRNILVEGIPQFGTLFHQAPNYYSFRPTIKSPVTISARQKTGSISVFVKLYPFDNSTKVLIPSQVVYDYHLNENLGVHKGNITTERLEKCGSLCTILIGVFTENSMDN